MGKVRILPDRVANQIAAGEVIERPAAVVKELVENALDAGATRIEVEFRHGGRSLMRVEDNGCGMGRDDALLALERHATSKIAEAADLDRLASYGFRGEALPSIASVSRFQLQTRVEGSDAGTEVLVNGGRLVHVRECGRPVGTRIEVSHLFNSVPARRKFLKSDQTEAAHIIHGVRLYALACPRTAFTLIEDGRVVFRSPECRTLEERVAEIFGRQTAESLVAVESAEADLRLGGLIGRPGVGRGSRHEMIMFVNARPVDSRTLNYALIDSYHDALPKGRYPVAFLFLDCDPAAVDVNVHPAKREVRFRNEPQVRGFLIRSVLQRLREVGAGVATAALPASIASGPAVPSPEVVPTRVPERVPTKPAAAPVAFTGTTAAPQPAIPPVHASPLAVAASAPAAPVARPVSVAPGGPAWRFLGLAHGAYAVFESAAGIVLLDRRAAHERVWFERLRDQFRAGGVPGQRLLLPLPVELDAISSALLLDRKDFLERHGFEVAEFGRNFFRLESIPAWMEPAAAEPFLRDLLAAFRDGSLPQGDGDLARDELARLAAAKAVRLPESAPEGEVRSLVAQLFGTSAPLTSPSGRPVFLELGHGELARRFQK